jgi:hypothetical protein
MANRQTKRNSKLKSKELRKEYGDNPIPVPARTSKLKNGWKGASTGNKGRN